MLRKALNERQHSGTSNDKETKTRTFCL
ncbi:unnamed protein product, partial [Didymodactylos carnosus]